MQNDYTSVRLEVFNNRALNGVSGPNRMQLTDGWTKLYEKELHAVLYSSPNITTVITLAERVEILRR